MSKIITQEEVDHMTELNGSYLSEENSKNDLEKSQNKYIVSVYLKGGHIINVECKEWKLTNNHNGSFSGYSFKGMKKGEQISISIPDIVAVKSVKLD